MAHMLAKNQYIPPQPQAQKTCSVEGVDRRMARIARHLASPTAEEALLTLAAIVESSDDAFSVRR
jgi:hypothetical protein